MCVEVLFLFWSSRTLQLGFLEIIPLLPRNSSVTNVNMWQPLRRGSNSKFRWNARSHSLPEKSSGANKSLQPGPLLLDCSSPLLYNARITKPFTVVINAERDSRLNMNQTVCKYCHLLGCRVNCTCYMFIPRPSSSTNYDDSGLWRVPTDCFYGKICCFWIWRRHRFIPFSWFSLSPPWLESSLFLATTIH